MPLSVKDAYKYCPRCGEAFSGHTDIVNTCAACGLHLYLSPKPCTTILLFNGEGRLLLTKRGIEPKKGYWDVPGGFCEVGESIEETAIREAREELHVEISVDAFLNSLPDMYEYQGILYPILPTGIVAHIVSGVPEPDDDVAGFAFFTPDEALQLDLAFPSSHKSIQEYLDTIDKKIPA